MQVSFNKVAYINMSKKRKKLSEFYILIHPPSQYFSQHGVIRNMEREEGRMTGGKRD